MKKILIQLNQKTRKLKFILRETKIVPGILILASILSLCAAFFEGISIALLIPLVNGIIKMDFSFISNYRVFKLIFYKFPVLSNASNSAIFASLVIIIFMTAVLKNIFDYFGTLLAAKQIRNFSDELRKLIFNRYLSFGKLFFDRNNISNLQNILLNFTTVITTSLKGFDSMISEFFMLIIYLVIMFVISWKLTILAMIIFPILNYSLKWVIQKIKMTSKYYILSHTSLSNKIHNLLSNISLVKLYSMEEKEKLHFATLSSDVKELEFSMDKKQNLINPIQEIIMLVAVLIFISAMAFLYVKERSGSLVSFLVFFYVLRRSQTAFNVFNKLKAALAAIKGPISAISKMFDNRDKFCIEQGKEEFKGLKEKIQFNHLTFSYTKEVKVLSDFTFSIEKGKVTAIVGPSGSGKTTIISLLLRLYDCPSGSIFINGIDLRNFNLKSLLAHFALVSQDIWLFNDTFKNNIIYGLDRVITDAELLSVIKKARLYDFIMSLPEEINTYIGDKGVRLSGGEKQRVAIARALLRGAEILILDEATSSLDSKTERLIQEAIDEAVKDRTSIIIAHRLSTIRHADKIIVIEKGELMEEGSLSELLERKGKFFAYWQEQKFY